MGIDKPESSRTVLKIKPYVSEGFSKKDILSHITAVPSAQAGQLPVRWKR
jgi:hypothetical protein